MVMTRKSGRIFDHAVNPKTVNWKSLFLVVVWLSHSEHL